MNWTLVLIVLVLSISYYVLSTIITNRKHEQRAKELGCQTPFRRQHHWPLSIDLVKDMMQADKDHVVPPFLKQMGDDVGHTTWVQSLFGIDNFVTFEPRNIQAILATQFNDFGIGEQRAGEFDPMVGHGIFTIDGKDWEHARAMLRPQFARDQVADLEVEESHVQDLMKHLPVDSSGWTTKVDLAPLFFRLTLDSATEFLFGKSIDSQVAALPADHPDKLEFERSTELDWSSFAENFDGATMGLGKRARLAEMYWLHNPPSFRRQCKAVHKFADYYVNLALSLDPKQSEKQPQQTDLETGEKKGKYVFLSELVKVTRDPIELRSQLLNILLAGRDTTAGLLGYIFWRLARHPDVLHKLRSTILQEFGSYTSPHNLTFSTLKSCTYLQHVMSETLRLHPTVPLNSRRATKDTTLPTGGGADGKSPVYVRKGQEVNYSVHMMHYRTDLWGPDAAEFKPDRWVGRKAGWEFLPFNGGPRICLGQQHALTLAGFVTVRLLQRFGEVENVETDEVDRHQYSVTTSPWRVCVRLREGRE